ncbi:MAG: serine/threonine-protein kinase, partial [Planctomycetaceae bacterium]
MSGPKESGDLLAMQAESWHAGECSPVEKLREQHAVENRDVLLDLIYSEVLLREEKGQSPDVEEYVVRFPALAEEIKRQFVVHSGFAEVDSTLKPDSTFDDVESGHDPTPMSRINIPGFELLEVIGRGGTAVAYRAHDETLNRTVAVKLLAGIDASGPGRRQQLMKEAEAAASLSHPSIVRIYQIGETADGVPFLVMDYLSGGSVATLMKDGPLDGDRAVSIILEVAKAIGYAHSCGVIHRDLKPGNILLDEEGKPYVCDFGLARKLDPNETRQSTNIVGTPAYMPPEQARGESVDERADVYSL